MAGMGEGGRNALGQLTRLGVKEVGEDGGFGSGR